MNRPDRKWKRWDSVEMGKKEVEWLLWKRHWRRTMARRLQTFKYFKFANSSSATTIDGLHSFFLALPLFVFFTKYHPFIHFIPPSQSVVHSLILSSTRSLIHSFTHSSSPSSNSLVVSDHAYRGYSVRNFALESSDNKATNCDKRILLPIRIALLSWLNQTIKFTIIPLSFSDPHFLHIPFRPLPNLTNDPSNNENSCNSCDYYWD